MNLALPEHVMPVRLRFEEPVSNAAFVRFCEANSTLRVERDASGELIVMSPTWSDTSSKNQWINYQLMRWVEETHSGVAFESNGGFQLPDTSLLSADAAWISWAVWNGLSEERRSKFAQVCPQFVIELRSASDRLTDVREKMAAWMRNGAELGWLIDPERKVVEIYRPGREPEAQEAHSAAYGEGPVEGFVLELGRIWG